MDRWKAHREGDDFFMETGCRWTLRDRLTGATTGNHRSKSAAVRAARALNEQAALSRASKRNRDRSGGSDDQHR